MIAHPRTGDGLVNYFGDHRFFVCLAYTVSQLGKGLNFSVSLLISRYESRVLMDHKDRPQGPTKDILKKKAKNLVGEPGNQTEITHKCMTNLTFDLKLQINESSHMAAN